MSQQSKIEWTDATWNPVTGCTKVSPGCANCYIERTPPFRIGHRKFDAKGSTGVIAHRDRFLDPLRWRKPRRVFVNSLSDLFHPAIHESLLDEIFTTMLKAKQHIFQVLTKRPERMREYISRRWRVPSGCAHPNVWLGVSVENQHFADERVPLLSETPAAVRFLSCEPLLGPVDLSWFGGINWVICGGESGPKARAMNPDWARSLRDQCINARVPFFFKQWGEHEILTEFKDGGFATAKVGKKRAGRLLDGREWNGFPA